MAAAEELGRSARWREDALELDVRLLLGDLPGHPTARLVGFDAPGWQVAVPKAKLRQARSALGRLPGLQALVDAQGLHLRWHDGRGGLDLRPVPVDPRGVEPALVVRLPVQELQVARPGPASARSRSPAAARPGRTGGAWLSHVLSDLGLLG